MRRRIFIALLGGAAATWPLAASAQQAIPVIGFLDSGAAEFYPDRLAAFRQGLAEVGYVEGKNVAVEFRWAQGRYDSIASAGGRISSPPSGSDFRGNPSDGTTGQSRDFDDPNCVRDWV